MIKISYIYIEREQMSNSFDQFMCLLFQILNQLIKILAPTLTNMKENKMQNAW